MADASCCKSRSSVFMTSPTSSILQAQLQRIFIYLVSHTDTCYICVPYCMACGAHSILRHACSLHGMERVTKGKKGAKFALCSDCPAILQFLWPEPFSTVTFQGEKVVAAISWRQRKTTRWLAKKSNVVVQKLPAKDFTCGLCLDALPCHPALFVSGALFQRDLPGIRSQVLWA